MLLPGAAAACGEVVLEIGIPRGHLAHPFDRGRRQRRATKVRVDDHSGCVEDPSQMRCPCCSELCGEPSREIAGFLAGAYLVARVPENGASRSNGTRIVTATHELVDRRKIAQPHPREV